MEILDADTAASHVDGLVHLDTQRAPSGLDLTVGRVARVAGPGKLDFGGSEFEPAEVQGLRPELAAPDDDYGWWELGRGTYVVRYNETVETGGGLVAQVHPLPRLMQAGASHPAFVIDGAADPLETVLTVGEGGCHLKENCRISRLVLTAGS